MKFVCQKSCCKHISLIRNYLLLSINEKTVFNDLVVGVEELFLNFFSNNNDIYYYNSPKLYKFNGKQFDEYFIKQGASLILVFNSNSFFCYHRESGKEYLLSLFDSNSKLEWEITTDKFYDVTGADLFLVTERFDTSKFSIHDRNNNMLWSCKLPDGYNFFHKPLLRGNVFYFIAYDESNRNQLVTGLDQYTGKILWQNTYRVTNENNFISAPAFNTKDSLYYGFGHVFQVFNPKTGEIVFQKEIDPNDKYQSDIYVNAVYDNKLWFVSGKYEEVKFGYVNLDTYKVDLLQDFPQENDEVFDTPVYHEGKLYLRGKFYNNLYVFE